MACFRLLVRLSVHQGKSPSCAILIRTDHLGDAILSCSIYEAYKDYFSAQGLSVTLVCPTSLISFFENSPFFDEIFPIDLIRFKSSFLYRLSVCRRLAKKNPRYAVKLPSIFGSGDIASILAIAACAKHTCGVIPATYCQSDTEGMDAPVSYAKGSKVPLFVQRLLSKRVKLLLCDCYYHRPFERFFTTSVSGIPHESPQDAEYRLLREITGDGAKRPKNLPPAWLDTGLPSPIATPAYLVVPGGNVSERAWPTANFAAIIDRIHVWRPELKVYICGVEKERHLAEEVMSAVSSGADITNLCGKSTMRELYAIIKSAEFVISNDTGTAHLAATIGKPTFVFMGYGHFTGETGLYFPNPNYPNAHCIAQQPPPKCRFCCWFCHQLGQDGKYPCVTSISPDEAWSEIRQLKN